MSSKFSWFIVSLIFFLGVEIGISIFFATKNPLSVSDWIALIGLFVQFDGFYSAAFFFILKITNYLKVKSINEEKIEALDIFDANLNKIYEKLKELNDALLTSTDRKKWEDIYRELFEESKCLNIPIWLSRNPNMGVYLNISYQESMFKPEHEYPKSELLRRVNEAKSKIYDMRNDLRISRTNLKDEIRTQENNLK